MLSTLLRCGPFLLALTASPLVSPAAPASQAPGEPRAPSDLLAIAAAGSAELLFDEPGDGGLWARGAAYKARFGLDGASIVPFFGSDAPRNFPLALRADSASLGGETLDATALAVARDGSTVRIERGSFAEEYVLASDSLEQRFVFDELPGCGDLVVRIDASGELAGSDQGKTLRFENEHGRLDYGEAFALDADGRRIALDSTLVDGAIELRVPASFVAEAALPLVIDPLVTVVPVISSTLDQIDPDVAYDATTAQWCVAWTSVWSQSDHDVFATIVTDAGNVVTMLTIDFTTTLWVTPRIANNKGNVRFLVVCAVVPPGQAAEIRGRLVFPVPLTVSAQFPISPADGIWRNEPDVGGDGTQFQGTYFCVTWARNNGSNSTFIETCLVRPDGTVAFLPIKVSFGALARSPRISSSLGKFDPWGTSGWTVVWQEHNTHDWDIIGAELDWAGTIRRPRFEISNSSGDDQHPSVSMLLDPLPGGGERPYMVVWEYDFTSKHVLIGAVCRGGVVLDRKQLSEYEKTFAGDLQTPSVDSDGQRFLVGYMQREPALSGPGSLWISNYYLLGNQLLPGVTRQSLAASPEDEVKISVQSAASSGGSTERYFAAWTHFVPPSNRYDIAGATWDADEGGFVNVFCRGDAWHLCPCNNGGAEGHGCENSANPDGALLTWSGLAKLSGDTFKLNASGMPPTTSCLFLQSSSFINNGSGMPFGDGTKCLSGTITRLAAKDCAGGAASYPGPGGKALSVAGHVVAGTPVYYQVWYRDPVGECSGPAMNLTNGLYAIWAP